jgi:hypothetical protein
LDLSVQKPIFSDSREISREFFLMGREIVEFCPKSANLMQEQGSSREFAGNLPLSTQVIQKRMVRDKIRMALG